MDDLSEKKIISKKKIFKKNNQIKSQSPKEK